MMATAFVIPNLLACKKCDRVMGGEYKNGRALITHPKSDCSLSEKKFYVICPETTLIEVDDANLSI